MSWLEADATDTPTASDGHDAGQAVTAPGFLGDNGTLPLETRRVLVQLLSGPSLDGKRHSKLWPVLVRDETEVRSRLADLFLDLVIDPDQQVAFTRQMTAEGLDIPVLLRQAPLTFMDSALLLYLRQRLTQADAHGERAVVSVEDMQEHLALYERAANTDRSGFGKRVKASIEKIKKHSLLQKIRASDERYEISPTLKLLFSAEEIQALIRRYAEIATSGRQSASPLDEPEEEQDL